MKNCIRKISDIPDGSPHFWRLAFVVACYRIQILEGICRSFLYPKTRSKWETDERLKELLKMDW